MLDRKPLIVFLSIAFGVSWPLFALPLAFRGVGPATQQTIAVVAWALAMWGPGLGALIATRFAAKRPLRSLNLGRLGQKRMYLWAWLVPPALALAAGLFTVLLGLARLDVGFSYVKQTLASVPGGLPVPVWVVVAAQIGLSLTLAPLINTLFGMGEELGWRGFLLPRLLPLGQWKAILLSGVIWGVWHAPVILQGHNYPSAPVLGTLMMVVACVLLGAIFSWLYLRTGSPWAPALAHGALNATAGLSILFLTPLDLTWGGTTVSPPGWIGMLLFIAWLIVTRRLPVAQPSTSPGPTTAPAETA